MDNISLDHRQYGQLCDGAGCLLGNYNIDAVNAMTMYHVPAMTTQRLPSLMAERAKAGHAKTLLVVTPSIAQT